MTLLCLQHTIGVTDWQKLTEIFVPVVNRETSLQVEASINTFACKDTGKECVFCLELLSQVPSWCSQLLVSTRSAWECNLKRATLRYVCLPKSRCRSLGTEKGGPSTVTDQGGRATHLWYFAALSVWSSLPSWFAWFQILLSLFLTSTTNSDCGIVWNVLTQCWKSPLLSRPWKASKNSSTSRL